MCITAHIIWFWKNLLRNVYTFQCRFAKRFLSIAHAITQRLEVIKVCDECLQNNDLMHSHIVFVV